MKFWELELKNIVKETSDTYSFQMEIPEGLSWGAGQHAMFKIKGYEAPEDEKDFRIFSIASSMEDGFVMFTTRIGQPHSQFKDKLLKLEEGDTILMAEPLGSFNVHGEYDKSLVIAGGIGITPIRSIFKHLDQEDPYGNDYTVFYSDDRGEFAYVDTFKQIIKDMDNLDFYFISNRDEFSKRVEDYAKKYGNESEYLIAGSPGMNKFFSGKLQDLGVSEANIKQDNFIGY